MAKKVKMSQKQLDSLIASKISEHIDERTNQDQNIHEDLQEIKKRHKRDDIMFWVKLVGGGIVFILFLLGYINLAELQGSLRILIGI